LAVALAVWAGCSRSANSTDGGTFAGVHAFDVVAVLDFGGPKVPANIPPTVPFTLVLDADTGHAIVGAKGTATRVALGKSGSKLVVPSFSVGLDAGQCAAASSLSFTSLVVAANDGGLTGTGAGDALVSCGDCQFNVPFTATVTGTPDVTPPLLFATTVPTSPFQPFRLVASEPLAATSTAHLVSEDGTTLDLMPTTVSGDVTLVTGFENPSVVLPTGVGLAVAIGGLVDFAGLAGSADTPLRFVSFPAPPLAPEDGFESATGTTFGGATVISGGPLPPISGTRSVYFGGAGAPAPGGVTVGKVLRVRLAVQPGDTTVAFSYRLVGPYAGGGFSGTISVGSVGKAPASETLANAPPGTATDWSGTTVYVTDVATHALALPPDVGDEVLLDIESFDDNCGRPMPALGGMLLDDLRLE